MLEFLFGFMIIALLLLFLVSVIGGAINQVGKSARSIDDMLNDRKGNRK